MGLSISKQGTVSASGENVNPNLLAGSAISLFVNTDVSGSTNLDYTIPDISKLKAGTKLIVSCDIELYNVATIRRIGCEPSFTSSSGNIMYVGIWTSDLSNRRCRIYSSVYTMAYDATGVGQRGIYVQGVTFNTGGYIRVSNPKLEIGTYPTPWCPHVNDAYYAGSNCGFFESSNPYVIGANTSFNKNFIVTKELIEI